jgi:predicted nuclease with TOPRIM domain
MTDSIYTIALFIISAGMTTIAGISAYLYRQRDGQFDAAARRCNELAEENEQYETALATSEATVKGLKETQAQLERIIHKAGEDLKATEAKLDWWKKYAQGVENENCRLESERANLYFRNAKGQIEPITPKLSKPHTLKHGMTVKDPTEAQAKRIFREARKAGIEVEGLDQYPHGQRHPHVRYLNDASGEHVFCIIRKPAQEGLDITPTEFIRRIRGEQE